MFISNKQFIRLVEKKICPLCEKRTHVEEVMSVVNNEFGIRCIECLHIVVPDDESPREFFVTGPYFLRVH